MFYDNFTENQICGLFTPWHFVAMALFAFFAYITIYFSRKLSTKQAKIILLVIAILVSILEIIKISIRIYKGQSGDSWIPVYFCSLFIFAIWLSFINNSFLKNMGYSFIVFGGIFASIVFTIYPSTSLLLFPIWHPASLHSMFYHFLMLYAGALVLIKNLYKPNIKHSVNFLVLTGVSCILAIIINYFLNTNMMFLSNPFGLPVLIDILNYSKVLYIIIASFAQCVLVFWICYGIYLLIYKFKLKK